MAATDMYTPITHRQKKNVHTKTSSYHIYAEGCVCVYIYIYINNKDWGHVPMCKAFTISPIGKF